MHKAENAKDINENSNTHIRHFCRFNVAYGIF